MGFPFSFSVAGNVFSSLPGGPGASAASQQQSHVGGVNNIGANNSSSSIGPSGVSVGSLHLGSTGGGGSSNALAPTSSYSSVAAAMYHQNAATVANVTAEMPNVGSYSKTM